MKANFLFYSFFAIVIFCLCNSFVFSQSYQVGHRQVTYQDPARSNRSIQTEIYYPATQAGDNVVMANGQFPIIVFGHGFVMAWSSYQNFWDSIVPKGYIMAFPRTEGNMSPSHDEFGKDLAFLIAKIKSEATVSTSFLYQKVTGTSAIMGHSMGGGAAFLAAKNNSNITTMISFAAANTTPSSITAAAFVTVPSLVFSGQNDGVAPPIQNQKAMYDTLASSCKTFISIIGGGHCYFANDNFNCSFGEGTTSPQPNITRASQQQTTMSLLLPYLNYMLKANSASGTEFTTKLFTMSTITSQRSCTVNYSVSGVVTYNNSLNTPLNGIIVNLMNGSTIITTTITNANGGYSFSNVANGTYTLSLTTTKAWGGVTSTDVLKLKRHIAGLELLSEPIRLSASDVNASNTITSTDVLKIQRRIAGLDFSFVNSDWLFEIPAIGGNNVIVNGANVVVNFYALCTGDVNGSFVPAQ